MSNNKTIQFNPAFFSGSGKQNSPMNKREKKEKPQVSVKPNKMKKQLLAKIKDFQNNTEKESIKNEKRERAEEEEFDQGFADEFNKSLNFLSELSKQRKQKPKNETLKRGKIEHAVHLQISTELPEELKLEPLKVSPPPVKIKILPKVAPIHQAPIHQAPINNAPINHAPIKPSPMYSNLKGGTLPTYRQYHNKTQKNYGKETDVKPLIHIGKPTNVAHTNNAPTNNVEPTNNVAHTNNAHTNNLAPTKKVVSKPSTKKPRFKTRITRTLKYSLGKHKNGKVSVLIKNAKTRRKVQTEQAFLKQTSIADIKLYLRSKNLLKVGSEVPNDVLRQLYESAILTGDVTNKSKDTLIHNFLNEK